MGNFFISQPNNPSNKNLKSNHKHFNKKTEQIYSDKIIKLHKSKYKITSDLQIKFINSFNEELNSEYFELFTKYDQIIFGFNFNKFIQNKFPLNITFIQFGHNFNNPICGMLTNYVDTDCSNQIYKLSVLIFGEHFNQPVNNLTMGIKKLIFGMNFNQDVLNLPTTIEYIKFGKNFNCCVDYLPCSLLTIIFDGNIFSQSIDNLPSSIEEIILNHCFNLQINYLPFKLKKISLSIELYLLNKKFFDTYTNAFKEKQFVIIYI